MSNSSIDDSNGKRSALSLGVKFVLVMAGAGVCLVATQKLPAQELNERTPAGYRAPELKLAASKNEYAAGEEVLLTLTNASPNELQYAIDHRVKIDGLWRGIGPYDIEDPMSKSKSVRLHTIAAGAAKTIKWSAPKQGQIGKIESFQFAASVLPKTGDKSVKVYSPELRIRN